jgi:hypothetical protein
MPLSAVFLPEGCLSNIIYSEQGPIKKEDLFRKGNQLVDIFKMEHFYEYNGNLETFTDRMSFFCDAKILKNS